MLTAPDDLPDRLPKEPPTKNEIYRLLEEWGNVERINDLRWEQWSEEKVCEYMIFNTDEGRGFRVIWDDGNWHIQERRNTY